MNQGSIKPCRTCGDPCDTHLSAYCAICRPKIDRGAHRYSKGNTWHESRGEFSKRMQFEDMREAELDEAWIDNFATVGPY